MVEGRRDETVTWCKALPIDSAAPQLPHRWKAVRCIGSGGQADVWLAEDGELGQVVAVKVFRPELSPTARERLRREVRLSRSLHHPGLVRMFELIEAGGRPAVVMEWMPGGSVAERLSRGPLPVAEVEAIAQQTLEVLAYLHARQVLHRDVKPSNLLVDAEGRVRLGDLGLARSLVEESDLTRTRTAVGTPAFMSPEQLRGDDALPASDLYALGVTLFQLVTGQLPFTSKSEFELARLHLEAPVPEPLALRRDCPPWFASFIVRLLQKDASDRFRDGGEALHALAERRIVKSPRMLRRRLAMGAVLVALASVGLGVSRLAPGLWRPKATSVEAAGRTIRGLDARGRAVWEVPLERDVQEVVRADLDGDGDAETIVSTGTSSLDRSVARKGEVVIVNRGGDVITRRHPEDVVPSWPFEFPKILAASVKPLDLDGDGRPEVVARCNHRGFYPAAIVVYWPTLRQWGTLRLHTGHLSDVAVIAGSAPARLQFAGTNNHLGCLPVVGELMVYPPASGNGPEGADPGWGLMSGSQQASLSWYTVLNEDLAPVRLESETSGTLVVGPSERVVRLDRWGNPVAGPNAGKDTTQSRLAFLQFVEYFGQFSGPVDRPGVLARLERTRAELAPLLAEAPYAALFGLVGGRALATVGDLRGAIEMLERARAEVPYEELAYRLAHLYAIAGRLEDATAVLAPIAVAPRTPRFQYDGVHLLLRLAIERRDEEGFRRVVRRLANGDLGDSAANASLQATLWARAHLWWDDVTDADAKVRSWLYAPDGAAIAALARWRLGRITAEDVPALETALEQNPEAAWEGRLALAAATSSLGRHAEAVAELGAVVAGLEPISRDDFMNAQLLDLARAVYCKVLAAAGHHDKARRQAAALRRTLREGLLPARLANEVLAAGSI